MMRMMMEIEVVVGVVVVVVTMRRMSRRSRRSRRKMIAIMMFLQQISVVTHDLVESLCNRRSRMRVMCWWTKRTSRKSN